MHKSKRHNDLEARTPSANSLNTTISGRFQPIARLPSRDFPSRDLPSRDLPSRDRKGAPPARLTQNEILRKVKSGRTLCFAQSFAKACI